MYNLFPKWKILRLALCMKGYQSKKRINKNLSLSCVKSMRDKYGVNHDAYCYPDTDVLVNILDVHNDKQLEEAEAAFSAERYRTYQSSSRLLVDFNLRHLQHLHHYLFQDLYSWAGE